MPRPRMRPRARIWQVMISFPFLESLVQLVLNLEGAVRRKVSTLRRARFVARRRCCSHCRFPLSLSLPLSLLSLLLFSNGESPGDEKSTDELDLDIIEG